MFEQLNQTTSTLDSATSSLSTSSTSNLALAGTASNLIDPLWQRVNASSGFSASSPGVFTVGATGQVSLDYLFDGGVYQGDVAIFSLAETDRALQDGFEAFAREVALRAVLDRSLGHLAISDLTEGARFSGSLPYEDNFNAGAYKGAKTFSMRPGDKFGIMLIPNGTVEDVLYGRNLEGDHLPLFSIPSLNLNSVNYLTQLVETHPDSLHQVDGNVFSMEDLRPDGTSDRDYNDVIFQVRGATGSALLLNKAINPAHDWRNSEVGQKLMSYANVDGKGLTAEYFGDSNFTQLRGQRTDGSVDFDWGTSGPNIKKPDDFSVRWTGQVEAQHSENYTLYTKSDEQVKLWVNGQLLINDWTKHTLTEDSGKITLKAGQKYDIKLEYAEGMGDASIQLLWSSASQPKEVIPQNLLYPNSAALPLDPDTGIPYKPNELLVKFNPALTDAQILSKVQVYGANSVERLVQFNSQSPSPLAQWRVVNFAPGINLPQVRNAFSRNADIQATRFDYALKLDAIPSDLSFDQQWGLNNTGQVYRSELGDLVHGTVDADIDAPEAWNIQRGSNKVIVAVIDTGVDYNHPDLAANIWTNSGEIPGNGIDDDGNGFVDDVHGYDFGDKDGDPNESAPTTDYFYGHGTRVAGIIGAVANNTQFDAGGNPLPNVVGVSQNVSIMPLKFKDTNGQQFSSYAASAIDYARANGAKVINASWGGQTNFFVSGSGGGSEDEPISAAIRLADSAGVLFVAGAGNDGNDNDINPVVPATYNRFLPNVISVAATDSTDHLASFSNFGSTTVDLAAPGVDILSTLPRDAVIGVASGTSMAAPFVAGAAALILAQKPIQSAEELKHTLVSTADPLTSLKGKTISVDSNGDGGRLNVYNALMSLPFERKVRLTINRVKGTDGNDEPDYYSEIAIGGPFEEYKDEDEDNPSRPHKYSNQADIRPQWIFDSPNLPKEQSTIPISIQIWDDDGFFNGGVDRVDINPSPGLSALDLSYNLSTKTITDARTGAIYTPDLSSGQVHLVGSGNEKQTENAGDADEHAEIWFTIEDSVVANT